MWGVSKSPPGIMVFFMMVKTCHLENLLMPFCMLIAMFRRCWVSQINCEVRGIDYHRKKLEVRKGQQSIRSLVVSTKIQEIREVDMSGSNAGFVRVLCSFKEIRNGSNRGCESGSFQVHAFILWSVVGSHGNCSRCK